MAAWLTIWLKAIDGEIRELHFHDRAHAFDGGTHGEPDHGVLRDRAVEHPPRKLFRETLGGFEGTAEGGDVLAVEKHARVLPQQGFLRFADGINVSHAHGQTGWAAAVLTGMAAAGLAGNGKRVARAVQSS